MRYVMGIVLCLVGFTRLDTWGQPRLPAPDGTQFVHFEAINLPAEDSAKSRIDIFYRIDKQFFIPIRNEDPSFPWEFMRRAEILVELIDTTNSSVAREIRRSEIGSNNLDTEVETTEWHQGFATFAVPPGLYRVVFEVDDLESDRRYFDRNNSVFARKFASDSFSVSSPVMLLSKVGGTEVRTFELQNFGGDILFGQPASLLIPALLPGDSALIRTKLTISEISTSDEQERVVIRDSTSEAVVRRGFWPMPEERSSGILYYGMKATENPKLGIVILAFPAEQLLLRRFTLTASLSLGGTTREVVQNFRVVWPDMPQSLRDVDYAIDALRYIVSEQKLDSLTEGSFENRRDQLEQFWRQRDPDARTADNEVMTQYYRRVDYAAKTYGTLRDPDGSKTDRGKVYILHGPPSKTQRSLDPEKGFREVWTYDALGKEFVFGDRSKSGNYTLISSRSL